MRRVVFNQKGGVGKTTIVCNLAAISAAQGKRTLVIDLDPQCNSSQYLLSSRDLQAATGTADFFEATLKMRLLGDDLSSYITQTPFDGLHIMAAHPDLEELRVKLEAKHKILKLRQALSKLDSYDEIYFDTPPALNFYSISALIAAQRLLIPFDCDDFARQALSVLLENIAEIQEDHNSELHLEGIVVNQFQSRANLPQRLVSELIKEGQPVLNTRLPHSVKIKESHDQSIPLIHMAPSHKVTQAFVALHDELSKKRK